MTDLTEVTAVTGRPLTDYEPFVELIAAAMCSGIAFIGDGVKSGEIDPRQPLESQAQQYAREFIRWRGAFLIDEAVTK